MAIQRRQLVEQVLDQLQQQISVGTYPPGSRLPTEVQLMEELGVGRSTVREAVRVLAHSGVLDVRQGDGTYVRAHPSAGEPLAQRLARAHAPDVHEVRRALEVEIARLAALRRTETDIENLRRLGQQRRTALASNDGEAALDADIALHCALADATHNPVLADLYRAFATTLRGALAALWSERWPDEAVADQHDALIDAVIAGNPHEAAATVAHILDRHQDLLECVRPHKS
ncbi:FadR/GntR family transcriptional regulator [Candidatus Chloroploca sp. Khr17]|uniref:FadR/GntR family transcriptional regulator n=1 Tax=Candidatus Chloroploca sp. Khr17 TaxID=2496869 RepID=UPI00101B9A84|nr:FadR/GntR family transcriptional regulator [Candidatus Chloroploca sp. Khr17]